jgi:hypothetical protein
MAVFVLTQFATDNFESVTLAAERILDGSYDVSKNLGDVIKSDVYVLANVKMVI